MAMCSCHACKPLPLASLATLASLASLLAILLAILLITQRLIPHLRVTSHMGPKPTGGEGRVYGEVGGPSLPVGRGEAESSPWLGPVQCGDSHNSRTWKYDRHCPLGQAKTWSFMHDCRGSTQMSPQGTCHIRVRVSYLTKMGIAEDRLRCHPKARAGPCL